MLNISENLRNQNKQTSMNRALRDWIRFPNPTVMPIYFVIIGVQQNWCISDSNHDLQNIYPFLWIAWWNIIPNGYPWLNCVFPCLVLVCNHIMNIRPPTLIYGNPQWIFMVHVWVPRYDLSISMHPVEYTIRVWESIVTYTLFASFR